MAWESWLGRTVEVVVEVPAGGFVKRDTAGRIDVVSPLPVPWNYGALPGVASGDGDPLDAVVLGPRRVRGASVSGRVWGVVDFVDGGDPDPKLIVVPGAGVGGAPVHQRLAIEGFFTVYARFKRVVYRLRGRTGPRAQARCGGVRWWVDGPG